MPRAVQSTYCTINDAAVPSLCRLARVSGHPNAHHHPPEAALGRADTIAPGRVHDDVRQSSPLKNSFPFKNLANLLKYGTNASTWVSYLAKTSNIRKILTFFLK